MDAVTLALARNYTDSQRLGYCETHAPGFVIPKPEDFVPDVTVLGVGFKWFSAEVPAREELMSVEVVFSKDGETYDGIYPDWNVLNEIDKSFAISNGVFTIMVAGELENALGTVPKVGMYYGEPVYTDLDKNLIGCKFSFRWETIHPIDPKYLPGAVLPVVKLSTTLENGITFTDEENALLKAAWEGGTPICVKCNVVFAGTSYEDCSVVFSRIYGKTSSGLCMFFCSFGSAMFQIISLGEDGVPDTLVCNIQTNM